MINLTLKIWNHDLKKIAIVNPIRKKRLKTNIYKKILKIRTPKKLNIETIAFKSQVRNQNHIGILTTFISPELLTTFLLVK